MLSAVPVSTLTIGVSQEPPMASPTALAIRRNVADFGAEATVKALSKDRRDEGLARRRAGAMKDWLRHRHSTARLHGTERPDPRWYTVVCWRISR